MNQHPFIQDENGHYKLSGAITEDDAIALYQHIITTRYQRGHTFTNPQHSKDYLRSHLAHLEAERFVVLFLDNRHRLIQYKKMFYGTIDGASVHPREVVRESLLCNAAALILGHNHPSGVADASQADKQITRRLKDACALVDIRLLDHIIVSGLTTYSMAEYGLV